MQNSNSSSPTSLLSIVVPCYNEEAVVRETANRLLAELQKVERTHQLRSEIIFIDNGSLDRTLDLLSAVADENPEKVKLVALSRNFGHQMSLTAGYDYADGDAVIAMDADLQDPVELIGPMVEKWRAGAQVVFGVRNSRQGESWFKISTAKAFYRILHRLTDVEIPIDTGEFRLMDRSVLEVFQSMREKSRFIRGMVPWIGFKQEAITYERAPRFAGETKYPLRRLLALAVDAVTSFSTAPLRAAYIAGFWIAGLSFLWASFISIRALFFERPAAGWSSVMVTVLFLGGVQLITTGVLGEYLGRIYDQVKGRPLYVINRKNSRGIRVD